MTQSKPGRNKRRGVPLSEVEEWIGRELTTIVGGDEATRSDIRRRLEVYGFDCPLHYDEEVAKQHGYRDITAPATMVITFSLSKYWEPGDPGPHVGESPLMPIFSVADLPSHGTRGVVTDVEVQYLEPVYPGDTIRCSAKMTKVVPKRTRIGDGAFITARTTYWKQTGEVVAIEDLTSFSYTPDEQQK